MKPERTFSSVVLPAPVPPETMTFSRLATAALQEVEHRLRQRLALDEVLRAEPVGAEAADRQRRAVERQRRNDRVDARAVLQARVDHRARLVDAAADRADDALDDLHQVPVVLEDDRRFLQHAVRARCKTWSRRLTRMSEMSRSLSSALERPEAEQLVEDVDDQVLALEQAERRRLRLGLDHVIDQLRISGSALRAG